MPDSSETLRGKSQPRTILESRHSLSPSAFAAAVWEPNFRIKAAFKMVFIVGLQKTFCVYSRKMS